MIKKMVLTMFVAMSIMVSAVPANVQAAEKSITVDFVVDKEGCNELEVKNKQKVVFKKKGTEIKLPDSWVNVTVKVLKIKGKQKKKKDWVMGISSEIAMNGGILETKKKELKKGAEFTFQGDECEMYGDIFIDAHLPKGVSSITYQVTIEDSKGEKNIKSVKEK